MTVARVFVLVLAATATIGCDRLTKRFATETLSGAPRQSFLADTVRLEYTENTGAFLNLGADWPPVVRTALLTTGPLLLLVIAMGVAIRQRWSSLSLFGLCLLVSGGLSNVADRILHGSVVDFLNVGFGPLRTGIFNVADVAVLVGAGIIVCTWSVGPDARRHGASGPDLGTSGSAKEGVG